MVVASSNHAVGFERTWTSRMLSTWLSPAASDTATVALDDGGYRHIWGASANTRNWWSLT